MATECNKTPPEISLQWHACIGKQKKKQIHRRNLRAKRRKRSPKFNSVM